MQKQIMRRVYYSYAISIGTHSMMWRGVFLGVATMLLAEWLHVASIVKNFLSVPLGAAPQYVANAFVNAATHGEILMVLTFITTALIAVSSANKIVRNLHWHTASAQTA